MRRHIREDLRELSRENTPSSNVFETMVLYRIQLPVRVVKFISRVAHRALLRFSDIFFFFLFRCRFTANVQIDGVAIEIN